MRAALPATVLVSVLTASAALAAATCGAPDATGTRVCAADPAVDKLALCNDGSKPAFSLRPGHGEGASRWLIWLEGGGQCATVSSCVRRAHVARALLTSNGFEPRLTAGVLSTDPLLNPSLHDVNVVVVHYCSSDDWAGDHASSVPFDAANPRTWNFEGRRVALAAIASVPEVAPRFAQARQIVLGGSSAGGLGVTVTANDILPTLPPAPDVRVVNDAGFAIDIGQFDPSIPAPYVFPGRHDAFDALFQSGMALWNGRGDAKCDAAAQTEQDHINCFSAYVFQAGYIAAPSFVAESQLDTAQLHDEVCADAEGTCHLSHNPNSPEGVYSSAFAAGMASALVGRQTRAAYAVYSPQAFMHTILTNAGQFGSPIVFPNGTTSAQKVFGQWLHASGGPRIMEVADPANTVPAGTP